MSAAATAPSGPRYRSIAQFLELFPFLTERWVKERLQPSHPERLQHHRFGNERVFYDEDVKWFEDQHLVPGAEAQTEEPQAPASVSELLIDPAVARRGGRALGLTHAA